MVHDREQFFVVQGGGCLLDHGPGDVHEAGEQVQVLQVTQESYRAAPCFRQPLGVQPLRFVV